MRYYLQTTRGRPAGAPAALSTYVGSFVVPASTGSVSYTGATGVPFAPQVLLLIGNGQTADAIENSYYDIAWCLGLGTASSQLAEPCSSDGNDLYVNPIVTTNILYRYGSGDPLTYAASLVSLDAGGFTLFWSNVTAAGSIVQFFAIAGLTNANIVSFTSGLALGTQAITGAGFQPDCNIFCGTGGHDGHGHPSWGMAVSSTQRATVGLGVTGTSGGDEEGGVQLAAAFATLDDSSGSPGIWRVADFVANNPDGPTLDWIVLNDGGVTEPMYALCLKGGRYHIGVFTQPASPGTQMITDPGFAPTGLLLLYHGYPASTTPDGNLAVGVGIASGPSNQGVMYYGDRSARPPTVGMSRSHIYMTLADVDPVTTETGLASLVAFTPTGFELNHSICDGTAREVYYLAMA